MGDLNGVSELILYKVNKFVISFIGIFIKYCIRGIRGIEMSGAGTERPKPKNRSASFTICRSSMVNIGFSKFIYNRSVMSLLSHCVLARAVY